MSVLVLMQAESLIVQLRFEVSSLERYILLILFFVSPFDILNK